MERYTTIGSIAKFSKETSDFSEFKNGIFEYLEISGVELGVNRYQTTATEVAQAPSRAKMKTQVGDIAISTTRPHRGAIVEIKNEGIIASTGFSIIRELDCNINEKWFLFTLLSQAVLQQMLQRSSGGNYPAIAEDEIRNIYIPLLDTIKQKEMVIFIEAALDKKVQKARCSDELLSSMNAYLFEILKLSNVNYNERLFCAVTLSNIVADKTFSAEYYHPERMAALHALKSNSSIPAVRLSNVVSFHRCIVSSIGNANYLGLAGVESQTGELSGVQEEANGQAFAYEQGDILYGRLRPYLNKVIVAENSGICSTEFHVMRVIDTATVLPEYVAAILRSDLILSQTKHMMTGNTHPRISNDDVQNLYIPIPDITVQREIVSELRKRRMEARQLKIEAEQEWQEARKQFEKELLGG